MKWKSVEVNLLLTVVLVHLIDATLSPNDKKSKKSETVEVKQGAIQPNIYERNLINKYPTPAEIIAESGAYCKKGERNFTGAVLGYVTPWNNHGYDVAKTFASKFTLISPVWLQVRRKSSGTFHITGTHDIDHEWVREVRKRGKKSQLKILPRILFDGWTGDDYYALFTTGHEPKELTKTIVTSLKAYKFDGVVLEVWSQLGGQAKKALQMLVKLLGEALTKADLKFVLVVPPPVDADGKSGMIDHDDIKQIYAYVDYFSVMTYDYSNPSKPELQNPQNCRVAMLGANSPIHWIEKNIKALSSQKGERPKFLMGLNFYGYSYTSTGGHPITGKSYLELLEKASSIQWSEDTEEHYFEIKDRNGRQTVFYPTLYSIQRRVKLAEQLNCGLAIWELGQGLDYFYDLL